MTLQERQANLTYSISVLRDQCDMLKDYAKGEDFHPIVVEEFNTLAESITESFKELSFEARKLCLDISAYLTNNQQWLG